MTPDDSSSDTLERLERAEQLKLNGKHSEALVLLEELLLEDPENVSALEEIADNELSLGRFERAETAASRSVTLDQESYTGYYILGFLRSRTEDWDEAIEYLQKANALKANNPEILRCLGWALFSGRQRAQGIVTLERSLNIDPDSALTLCDLGIAYLHVQNFRKSKMLFARALDLEPENTRARECMATCDRCLKMVTRKGQGVY
jgi:tetratricopeptide (TPR) repeat protein